MIDKMYLEDYGGNHYVSDLTRDMDKYIKDEHKFRTYILPINNNIFEIRYPGDNRGVIEVKNNIIKKIYLVGDESHKHIIYDVTVVSVFDKYVDKEITFEIPVVEEIKDNTL